MLADKKIELELTPAARALIAKEGYDPNYGARPLRRVLQRRIQDSMALEILDGKIQPGDKIRADVAGDGLRFEIVSRAEPVSVG